MVKVEAVKWRQWKEGGQGSAFIGVGEVELGIPFLAQRQQVFATFFFALRHADWSSRSASRHYFAGEEKT